MKKMNEVGLYNAPERLIRAYQRLENDGEIMPENRMAITSFMETKRLQGVRELRQLKLIYHLQFIGRKAEKLFKEMDAEDTKELLGNFIGNSQFSSDTQRDYGIVAKMLFRHVHGSEDGEIPTCIKWLKPKKPTQELKKSDLITADELARLLQAADDVRKKAFIITLYESGCRIAELLEARIKDLQFDANGAVLSVRGKTGVRAVRLIQSVGTLGEHLNQHPRKNDENAPLFFVQGRKGFMPIMHTSSQAMLRRLFSKAGVSMSKARAHRFRHSRAAETKRFMPEDYMRKHFGWAHGSPMPSHYGAFSTEDVDNCLLQAYQKAERKTKEPENLIHGCERCHNDNLTGSVYCRSCGFRLGSKVTDLQDNSTAMVMLKFLISLPNVRESVASLPTEQIQQLLSTIHQQLGEPQEGESHLKSEAPGGKRSKNTILPRKKPK